MGVVLLSHGQPSLQAAIQNFDCGSTQPNINPPSILACVWDLPKCDHRIIFHPIVSELNKTKYKAPLLWYQGEVVVGTDVHITYNHSQYQFPPLRLCREVPSWWFAGSLGRIAESFPASSILNRFPWIFHNTFGSLDFLVLLFP